MDAKPRKAFSCLPASRYSSSLSLATGSLGSRLLVEASKKEGVGHSYLIQHSTGSGKSNTIGWVAHRMASLHNQNGEKVFDSIVVITDCVFSRRLPLIPVMIATSVLS